MFNLDAYRELMEKCSHCSFCQSSCPVYKESLLETYVARFRVELIREVLLEKTMPLTDRVKEVVDRCLLCTNCQQTCPASIPVPEIVINARYQIYQGKRMDFTRRFVLKQLMKKRGLKGIWSLVGKLGKKMGVAPEEIPDLASRTFESFYPPKKYPTNGKIRARVAYYVGCATNTMYSDTGDAVMKVLQQNGIEVVLPKGLVCCGLPALGEGDIDLARALMLKNLKILSALKVDAIVTDCTSCGLTLKSKILKVIDPADSSYKKAEKVATMIFDVMDYLNKIGLSKKPEAKDLKFSYHVPCHNAWSPGLAEAPVELFKSVALGQYHELEAPQQCCGAGGSFFVENKKVAQNIRAPRIADIQNNEAGTVITQCPLCRMYLSNGLGNDKKVTHPIQVLANAYDL
jgi:glycolate oxidase iron-sulfur subunit